MHFLVAEHGEAVSVMRSIKQALDPKGILSPGTIFELPDASEPPAVGLPELAPAAVGLDPG